MIDNQTIKHTRKASLIFRRTNVASVGSAMERPKKHRTFHYLERLKDNSTIGGNALCRKVTTIASRQKVCVGRVEFHFYRFMEAVINLMVFTLISSSAKELTGITSDRSLGITP